MSSKSGKRVEPSLIVLRHTLLMDIQKDTSRAPELILMALDAAYGLGKEATLRQLRETVADIIDGRNKGK